MKKEEIRICKVCGKLCNEHKSHEFVHGMCRKHYEQVRRFGKVLDNNPRTIWDPNEIRVLSDHSEIDTYDEFGNVQYTYIIDTEDIPLLNNKKWRTVLKGKQNSPYLVTGHAGSQGSGMIYFHRLICGNPNSEVDHINRNTLDNRKSNLREANRLLQVTNTNLRMDNTSGVKGIYYITSKDKYRAEIQRGDRHIYSPLYDTIEEAAYMRYLLEQFFYNDIGINNSSLLLELIQRLPSDKKERIDNYFKNRAKAWV